MSRYPKLLTALFVLSLAGCASKGDMNVMQTEIDEIKTHTIRFEKDLAGIRGAVREELEKNNLVVRDEVGKVKKDTRELQDSLQKELENFRKGAADLQASLETAKVDVRVLNGKIETIGHQIKKPGEDVSLLREDLERRFSLLDERLKKLEAALEDVEKKNDARKKEAEQNPDVLYQKGLSQFKEGQAQQARDTFNRFLELFPAHSLASNARYWIGETYYSEKKFEQAILEFQQLIKNHPGKEKVAAAMLKQGMAFRELGDAKSARFVYSRLLEEFPSTPEAKSAKDKLKELK